jgi:spermidine/putrescine transport system ATP-binding protein
VSASFEPGDARLSDNPDDGQVRGHIVSIIYMGDHYRYIVRSSSERDYYVNDEWLWNIGDYVSVVIPEDKIMYRLL